MENLDTFFPESYYMVYNRANNDERIFTQERNYLYFLHKFDYYLSPVLDVMSYCLLETGFVFLVRIKSGTVPFFENNNYKELSFHNLISKQFRDLFTTYSKAFNRQEERIGSLFQRPYKRVEIHKIDILKKMILYIHTLPFKYSYSGDCYYRWSSYKSIISKNESKLLKTEVLELFGNKTQFIKYHKVNLIR